MASQPRFPIHKTRLGDKEGHLATLTPHLLLPSLSQSLATAAVIMSFFKKLANEFEKLDFGSDDKDKRKNEAQPQSSRGKHGPHPRCAASRWKLQAGRSATPPCRFTELPLITPNRRSTETKETAPNVNICRISCFCPSSPRPSC